MNTIQHFVAVQCLFILQMGNSLKQKNVRIAIIGVGNCASALIQCLSYYSEREAASNDLLRPSIGGYSLQDINIVCAFDIDRRKVGLPLNEAIFSLPNSVAKMPMKLGNDSPVVLMGEVLDGCAPHMSEYPEEYAFRVSNQEPANVFEELVRNDVDLVVSFLPVGSDVAIQHYAEACIKAKCGLINCSPCFIASDKAWVRKFEDSQLPLIGDDIKSQFGSTILHRYISQLCVDRGVKVNRTYQLNSGGNADFLNMQEHSRLKNKKKSKTEAVQSVLPERLGDGDIHIGPSDFIPWLKDNKIAFIRVEGEGFGGQKIELDMKLSVQDSSNSAGVVVDAIRCGALALDRGVGGTLEGPSAVFMKFPPVSMKDQDAVQMLNDFIKSEE